MPCIYFNAEAFGVCSADGAHVPTILEMERYCFSKYHRTCPHYADTMSGDPAPCRVRNRTCLDRSCSK